MKKIPKQTIWVVAAVHALLVSGWFGGLNGLGVCTLAVMIMSIVAWLMGCSHGVKLQQREQINRMTKNYGPASVAWRG